MRFSRSSVSAVVGFLTAASLSSGADGSDSAQQRLTGAKAAGNSPFTKEFASLANELLDEWKVPGISIAVVDGDNVHAEGYGFATLPDIRATPETLWYAGSTTKAQVAAALAHLIDTKNHSDLSQGWTTPISTILHDDFVLQNDWATKYLTLDDAVSHRTGFASHDASWPREVNGKQVSIRDIVRNMRHLPFATEPRIVFQYCNYMFVVLSHIVETITKQPLAQTLRSLIWDPLGMNSTYFSVQAAMDGPEHLASGYYWDKDNKTYQEIPPMSMEEVSGAGAVISNVLDYSKWIKCLLNKDGPFSEKVHQDIRTPRMMDSAQPVDGTDLTLYGLAWWRTVAKGHVLYRHSGGTDAFTTQVFWLPGIDFGVVAFGNTAGTATGAELVLVWKLIYDRLGISAEDRFDFGQAQHESQKREQVRLEHAVDVVFPSRPESPLPPTLPPNKLAGTYHDAGYGTITLREEPHPEKPDETILVADRPEMTWKYQMRLHHVTGDYWIMYHRMLVNPGSVMQFEKTQFEIGVDGGVEGLRVDWGGEEVTFYKRVR